MAVVNVLTASPLDGRKVSAFPAALFNLNAARLSLAAVLF